MRAYSKGVSELDGGLAGGQERQTVSRRRQERRREERTLLGYAVEAHVEGRSRNPRPADLPLVAPPRAIRSNRELLLHRVLVVGMATDGDAGRDAARLQRHVLAEPRPPAAVIELEQEMAHPIRGGPGDLDASLVTGDQYRVANCVRRAGLQEQRRESE